MLPVARASSVSSRRAGTLHRARDPDPAQDRLSFPANIRCCAAGLRVIRDSDIEVEEEPRTWSAISARAIKRRRRGKGGAPGDWSRHARRTGPPVKDGLDAATRSSQEPAVLGMADLRRWSRRTVPTSNSRPFDPRFPERIREHGGDCFAAIRDKDILVHHPYESFEVVVEFVQQAAADPDVVAIKQTLYRAGKQSAIIRALIDAAEAGKSVTAVVELKARFDEEQNILWANALERAGVQVVLRLHRLEDARQGSDGHSPRAKGYRTYCHFGTGNYHPVTARIYTDSATSPPIRGSGAMRPSCSTTSPATSSRRTCGSSSSRRGDARRAAAADRRGDGLAPRPRSPPASGPR